MSKRDFNLIAIKKPRDNPIQDKPINFPPLKNLHLELLENKKKIKSGLPNVVSSQKIIPPKKEVLKQESVKKEESKQKVPKDSTKKDESNSVPKNTKKELPKDSTKKDVQKSTKKDSKKNTPKQPDPHPDELILEEIIDDEDMLEDSENNFMEDELGESEGAPSDISDDLPAEDELIEEMEEDIEEEENLEEMEEENLEEGEEKEEEIEEGEKEEGGKEPDDGLTPEERERREKEEYIWRFRILKKKYPNPKVNIPDYNEHSDLTDMKNAYDRTTRELYLDGAVDSYRTYLVGGFMVTEFVCNNWLNIDLEGFTAQQAKMMYKYDMLLIELGEKSYNKWGMNIPVEIRLAGLIILQAGLFYLGKIITANYGGNVASIFKGMSGQPPDQGELENEEPVKKKMKGPKFKADDIRNMTKGKKE